MIAKATKKENENIDKIMQTIKNYMIVRITKKSNTNIVFESKIDGYYKLHKTSIKNSKILKIDTNTNNWQKIVKFHGMTYYFKDITDYYGI